MVTHSKIVTVFFSLLIASIASSELFAHSMWLDKKDYGYDFSYGELGDTDLYDPTRVVEVAGYNSAKEKTVLDVKHHIVKDKKGLAKILVEKDFSMLTGELDNKYWFNTKDGWKNTETAKDFKGHGQVIEQGKSYKYTKHITKWEDYMSQPIGAKVEIVPLSDPTKLKEGDFLEVQLYLDGKLMPTKEARIGSDSNPYKDHELIYLKSSKPIKIKISQKGLQLIEAKYKLKLEGKEVEWYSLTITFNTHH